MSKEYDEYIKEHCANVRKGFYWIKRSLPEVLIDIPGVDYELNILLHDDTKYNNDEYDAYDEYFYGKNQKTVKRKCDTHSNIIYIKTLTIGNIGFI